MSILSLIRRAPKRISAAVAMIAIVVILPASLHAWGPSRATFTTAVPATYVTFNSITDNPVQGDERNFMQIKDASAANSTYADSMNLQAGHTYTVFMYYHNDASSSLNASGVGVAHGAYIRTALPNNVNGSNQAAAYVGAANANPGEVYDDVALTSSSSLSINFVPGSAHIYSQGPINGSALSNNIATTGVPLGYSALDGVVPGCNAYSGYVTYNFTASSSSYTFSKEVSKHGANSWTKDYKAQPGETVDYLLQYKNTGTTVDNNVVVKDQLPAGETYVAGSTTFGNSNFPNGTKGADGVTTTGINIGDYAGGANAWVIFSATVAGNDALSTCGPNTLVNHGSAVVGSSSESDTANVDVTKTCTTTPTYTCTALTASLVSGTQYKFNGSASASNGASIVNYVFNFGDGNSQTVTNPSNVLHTYATKGATYKPSLTVNVMVNGANKAVTSEGCTTTITVGSTPECKPGIPVGDSRCTTPQCLPGIPVGDARCTVTPPLLPHTGPTDNIVAFLGLGALIASIIYYVRSRRAIRA